MSPGLPAVACPIAYVIVLHGLPAEAQFPVLRPAIAFTWRVAAGGLVVVIVDVGPEAE